MSRSPPPARSPRSPAPCRRPRRSEPVAKESRAVPVLRPPLPRRANPLRRQPRVVMKPNAPAALRPPEVEGFSRQRAVDIGLLPAAGGLQDFIANLSEQEIDLHTGYLDIL